MQEKYGSRIKQTFRQSEDGRFLCRHGARDYKLTREQAAVLLRYNDSCLFATGFWGLFCVLVAAVYATTTHTNAGQALAGAAGQAALYAVVLATAVLGLYTVRQLRKRSAFLRGCESVALPKAEGLVRRWQQWGAYLNTHPNLRKFPTWILVGNCGLATVMGARSFMDMVTPPARTALISPLADRVVDGIAWALFVTLFAFSANLLLARVTLRHWAKASGSDRPSSS